MDYFFLPQSISALDRWSDRAIRIVHWEFVLALSSVIAASSYFPKPSESEFDHPPMTKANLAVALPTIFLPLASCVTSWQSSCHRVRVRTSLTGKHASTRAPTKPLIYSSFQILQLIACSWVAAHDFVILSARSPWFWFSLVGELVPALAGTIYGLVGIARFFFAGSAQLAPHRHRSSTAGEEYSDDTIEHCALERAYKQQLPDDATDPDLAVAAPADGHQPNGGDILLSQLRHEETTYTRPRNIPDLENNATAQDLGASQTLDRNVQTRSRHSISPPTRPRFRWQEQTGARNGGTTFWAPIVATLSLISIWSAYYKWLVRNSYYSPELMRYELLLIPTTPLKTATCKRERRTNINLTRLLALEAIAPITISFLANAFLTFSLRKPILALIFTAFCFSVLASAIWFAEFVYCVWCFFYYMRQISIGFNLTSFASVLVSFGMTWCHVALLRCSVRMEWTPGYSSLMSEYKLWKERRDEAEADTEEAEDEEI
jgi:hypothetical protein